MFHDIRAVLERITEPHRGLDALIMLYLLGEKHTSNIPLWVLSDNPSKVLCRFSEQAPSEETIQRLNQICLEDDREMIFFEYHGHWFHFVTSAVPTITASVENAFSVIQRAYPDITMWEADSEGSAKIWGPSTLVYESKNNIASAAMVNAILKRRFEEDISDVRIYGGREFGRD